MPWMWIIIIYCDWWIQWPFISYFSTILSESNLPQAAKSHQMCEHSTERIPHAGYVSHLYFVFCNNSFIFFLNFNFEFCLFSLFWFESFEFVWKVLFFSIFHLVFVFSNLCCWYAEIENCDNQMLCWKKKKKYLRFGPFNDESQREEEKKRAKKRRFTSRYTPP